MGGFSHRTGAHKFFLVYRDIYLSSEQLMARHVIFIDTTSAKMVFCTLILLYGLIVPLLSDNLY